MRYEVTMLVTLKPYTGINRNFRNHFRTNVPTAEKRAQNRNKSTRLVAHAKRRNSAKILHNYSDFLKDLRKRTMAL